MRAAIRSLSVLCVTTLCAATSGAAVLPFAGSLQLLIDLLPPVTIAGSGVATVNGPGSHLATLALPAWPFAGTGVVLPLTDPVAAPIASIQLTAHNGAGTIMAGGGVIPLLGVAKVCLFLPCAASPQGNISIPLNAVGVGGAAFVVGLVNVTAIGAPWTVGTAAVGTLTQMGFAHGPASLTSSTAAASGTVQVVTPVLVLTNLGSLPTVPTFGVMTLHFVPEPSTMLLLGAGLSALALAGRHRMRAGESGSARTGGSHA
jgi:hypothetical protein